MSKVENNCSVVVSVTDDGWIKTKIAPGDGEVILTQDLIGAHCLACDLLDAIGKAQDAKLSGRERA